MGRTASGKYTGRVQTWVSQAPAWLEKRPLLYAPDLALGFLDRGEREAIALAEQLGADRMIVDEALAREEATRCRLAVIGTLGILRNAARVDLLRLPEALADLQKTNFYVAPHLIQSLLDEDAARWKV